MKRAGDGLVLLRTEYGGLRPSIASRETDKATWNPISFLAKHLQSHERISYLRAEHFFMSGRSNVRIWTRRPDKQYENPNCLKCGGATGLCVLLDEEFFACLLPFPLT